MPAGLTLDDDELREVTGKRRAPAQRRALDHLGIPYRQRPDGTLVVLRAAAEAVLAGPAAIATTSLEPQLQP
jgi:hypothetical protein